MNSKQLSIALGVVVVVLLAVVGYMALRDNPQNDTLSQQNTTPNSNLVDSNTNTQTQQSNSNSNQIAQYRYEYQPNSYKAGDLNSYDGKIIQIDSAGKSTIIVPSVKKAYGLKPDYVSLGLVAQPSNSQNLYFHLIPNESDGSPWDLIRFSPQTKLFTKLKASSHYKDYHPKAIQKSSQYIVSAYNPSNLQDGQSLFLIDLESDKVTLAAKLPSSETLNACWTGHCLGEFSGEISWVDSQYVQAAIYSSSETTTDEYGNRTPKLIEKRKIKVR